MEDLTTKSEFPYFWNFDCNTTLTKVLIPQTARIVKIGSKQSALYVCRNGATEGESPPVHKAFIPKSNYLPFNMGRGSNRINELFICSQSGSANVSLILTEE